MTELATTTTITIPLQNNAISNIATGTTSASATSSSSEATSSVATCIENLGKQLQCPICLNLTSNPHTLPCTHFFCHHCIQQLITSTNAATALAHAKNKKNAGKMKAGHFECPTCRTVANHRQVTEDKLLDEVVRIYAELRLVSHEEMGIELSQGIQPMPYQAPSNKPPPLSPPSDAAALSSLEALASPRFLLFLLPPLPPPQQQQFFLLPTTISSGLITVLSTF